MGPYCKFCGKRCFVHIPAGTPKEILKAYEGVNIIATCKGGQKLEKDKRGVSFDTITAALKKAAEEVAEYEEGEIRFLEQLV